jgi:hypothetical protein
VPPFPAEEIAFASKWTIPRCWRIQTRWTTRGHEEGRHYGGLNRSFVARYPHHPAILKECGSAGVRLRADPRYQDIRHRMGLR